MSEEKPRGTVERGNDYAMTLILPELRTMTKAENKLQAEYGSADNVIAKPQLAKLLRKHKLLVENRTIFEEEMIA